METKLCKHCQNEIPKKAKVCPNCKKKQGGIGKWIIIAIIVLLLIGSMGGSDEGADDNNSVNNTGNVENNNAQNGDIQNNDTNKDTEENIDNVFSVGEFLETDSLKISYLSCEEYKSDNQFLQPKDGYVYYRLEFEFENIGNNDAFVSSFDFTGYADGYAVEQTYFDDNLSATLSAGKKGKGAVYFEVPADATEVTAEYEMNYWTEEKVIFVIK